MADSVIEDEIIVRLMEGGPVTVSTHGEFRTGAGICGSGKQVKRALGSLISRGMVHYHRPLPRSCSDNDRPITYSYVDPTR